MICPPCKTGGHLAAESRRMPDQAFRHHLLSDAADWHARCEYPHTCPCQHKTGKFVPSPSEVPK